MSSVRDIRLDYEEPVSFQNDVFDEFIELYLSKLENCSEESKDGRKIYAIIASPLSMAARALIRNAKILRLAHVDVKVVFGQLSPIQNLAQWFDPRENFKISLPNNHFRYVKNELLLDAHEQVVLGNTMCWSGDSMKRRVSQRDSFELFEDSSPAMARLGRLAFEALWDASADMPRGKLKTVEKILSGGDVPRADISSESDVANGYAPQTGRVCH